MSAVQEQTEEWDTQVEENLDSEATFKNQLLTFYLDQQIFGIPVRYIKDIFKSSKVSKVPLTPPDIAGVVNLRGHIVTAINLRHKLCFPPHENESKKTMNIAVSLAEGEEMYSLIVDSVAEVMTFSEADFEQNPSTVNENLKALSTGIFKLENNLLIILDVKKILDCIEKNDRV